MSMGRLYEYRQMLCLSILLRHGKVMHRRDVNTSRAERYYVDIYGVRIGKEGLQKDPSIFQQGPAANIICKTHALNQQGIETDER